MSELLVVHAGESRVLTEDDELTFGREGDLVIDVNPYLHRKLGRFLSARGIWSLQNTGSAIALEVCDAASSSRMTIAPGTSVPLPFARSVVRFQAGAARYELDVVVAGARGPEVPIEATSGSPTITASGVPLNREQRLLLVSLAEFRLRDRFAGRTELPTNRQVADRLGWGIVKFNRKLDTLCAKFARLGVDGLKGDLGALAVGRRERLVDYVLAVGLIGPEDLALLDRPDTNTDAGSAGPGEASDG